VMCDPNTLFIIYALLVIERICRDVGTDSRFARLRDVQSINSTHVYYISHTEYHKGYIVIQLQQLVLNRWLNVWK